MKRRDTRVSRAAIKDSVIREVWVRAAGRCVLCSAYLLGGEGSFFHTASHGEVAHNTGATGGRRSPRGASELSLKERAGAENLLLLCHKCHRQVDAPGAEEIYTEDVLRTHKVRHEARVRKATDFATKSETAVLRFTARVRGTLAPVTDRQIAEALHSESLTYTGETPRDAEFLLSLESEDSDSWVWEEARDKITKRIRSLREAHVGTLSVFAMAPIPMLVFLGAQLDDKDDVRVFPRIRGAEDAAWCWRDDAPLPLFEITTSQLASDSDEVVVAVSVSASISLRKAGAELQHLPVVHLSASTPHPDAITTKAASQKFAAAWRETLARVEQDYPHCRTIHLIAAVPLTAAVACGQHHMGDAQPDMVIYQRTGDTYAAALTISRRVGTPDRDDARSVNLQPAVPGQ